MGCLCVVDFKTWVKSDEFKTVYKSMPKEIREAVRDQIPKCGSGGSGNHFWELQTDSNNDIWFMIHSGSRKLGQVIASYYNKKAIELNKKYHSAIDASYKLAFLPLDTEYGAEYLNFMEFACKFAMYNHDTMIKKTEERMKELFPDISFLEHFFVTHNYASIENHYGKNVVVHSKGATLARGNTGIIPGSQGSSSFIVKGKSNPESFNRCSHGAGRALSRTKAKATLDINKEIASLDAKGVIHSIRSNKDLEEAPSAYKDINAVMKNQEELVEIITELTPIAVIKG